MAEERDTRPAPEPPRDDDDDRRRKKPKPKPRPELPGCKITFSPWVAHTDNAAFGIEAQQLYWLSDQVGNFDCGERNCRLIGYHFMEDIDRVTPDDVQTRAGNKYLLYGTCGLSFGECDVGACCISGGHCENLEEAECAAFPTSAFFRGLPCEFANCGEEACCKRNGSCVMLPPEVCRGDPINPGIPQGPGTLCRPNFCQACCVPFGAIVDQCMVTMPPDCLSRGGTPQGNSTQCIAGERQCSTGACCLASLNEAGEVSTICQDDVQSGQCISRNGFFLGHGSSCVANTCPPGGACCLWSGDCIMTFEDTCIFFNQEDCGPQFFWQGDDTACSEVECPPIAKCCHGFAAQDCDNKTEDECRDLGGVWGSPFERLCCTSDTDPCLGACCSLDGLLCQETDAPTCVFHNQGVFMGFGTLCEQIDCPTVIGACCYRPTGDPFEARVCIETTLDDCINSKLGEFMGAHRPCFDSLCIDVHACCLPFPGCGCNETVTEAECDLQDGTWWPALSCADILTSSCLCPGDPLCVGFCCGNPDTVNCHDTAGDPQERPCCRGCICCKAVCLFIDPVCCDQPEHAFGWDFICADLANKCCTPTCWETCNVPNREEVCQYLGFGPPP